MSKVVVIYIFKNSESSWTGLVKKKWESVFCSLWWIKCIFSLSHTSTYLAISLATAGPPIISSDPVQYAVRGERGEVKCYIASTPPPDKIVSQKKRRCGKNSASCNKPTMKMSKFKPCIKYSDKIAKWSLRTQGCMTAICISLLLYLPVPKWLHSCMVNAVRHCPLFSVSGDSPLNSPRIFLHPISSHKQTNTNTKPGPLLAPASEISLLMLSSLGCITETR